MQNQTRYVDSDLARTDFDVSEHQRRLEEQKVVDAVNHCVVVPNKKSLDSTLNASIEEAMTQFETDDLIVQVHQPEKVVKAMESYVLFSISTKTGRANFTHSECTVKRRYSDFLWLRQHLVNQHPALLVPPLPEKSSLTLDRFDVSFVKYREVGLNDFMRKICRHPILSYENSLSCFLTLNTDAFEVCKRKSTNLLTTLSSSWSSITSSYQSGSLSSYELQLVHKYVIRFGEKMESLERITLRLREQHADYRSSLERFSLILKNWARCDLPLSTVLSFVAESKENEGLSLVVMTNELPLKVILPLRQYALFADVIKTSLLRQDLMQLNLHTLNESAQKLQETRNREGVQRHNLAVSLASENGPSLTASVSGRSSEQQTQALKTRSESRLAQVIEDRDKAADRLEVSAADFKADLERWHIVKKRDVKQLMSGLAERNIDFYDNQICDLQKRLEILQAFRRKSVGCV